MQSSAFKLKLWIRWNHYKCSIAPIAIKLLQSDYVFMFVFYFLCVFALV